MKLLRWGDVKPYASPQPTRMGNLAVVMGVALVKYGEEEREKEKKLPEASPERKITNSVIEPRRRSRRKNYCPRRSYSDPNFKTNQRKSNSSDEKPTASTTRSEEEEEEEAAVKYGEEEREKEKKLPVASPERKIEPKRSSRKRYCSKGSYNDSDFKTNQKKSKSSNEKPTASTTRSEEEEKKEVDVATAVPNPPPDMPEEFKDLIRAVNGTEVVMVIQKSLTATDLKPDHGRLSIPFGKINRGFLRENEREVFAKQATMEVPFMEPSQTVSKMAFRQWDMPKKSGKTSSMYVIRTYWNDVAKANALHKNDVVQIWSFRVGAEQQLRLALVVVSRAPDRS